MSYTVLIADDSKFSRRMLKKSFPEGWDINIIEVSNGKEALEKGETEDVDILFLDLTMPELDGFCVLQSLKESDSNCKIIVISADVQLKAIETCKELGALAFVPKPHGKEKLQETLENLGLL